MTHPDTTSSSSTDNTTGHGKTETFPPGQKQKGVGVAQQAQRNGKNFSLPPKPAAERSQSKNACARVTDRSVQYGVANHARWGDVPPDEQAFLAGGLGRRLREVRLVSGRTWKWPGLWVPGMSIRVASVEIGCGHASLSRLERGLQRPRESMLRAIANVYRPDAVDEFTAELVALAGPSLVAESRGSERRRARRVRTVGMARYRLFVAATELDRESIRVVNVAARTMRVGVVNAGCRSGATDQQYEAALMEMARQNAALDLSHRQQAQVDRMRAVLNRRKNLPGAGSAGLG